MLNGIIDTVPKIAKKCPNCGNIDIEFLVQWRIYTQSKSNKPSPYIIKILPCSKCAYQIELKNPLKIKIDPA